MIRQPSEARVSATLMYMGSETELNRPDVHLNRITPESILL